LTTINDDDDDICRIEEGIYLSTHSHSHPTNQPKGFLSSKLASFSFFLASVNELFNLMMSDWLLAKRMESHDQINSYKIDVTLPQDRLTD